MNAPAASFEPAQRRGSGWLTPFNAFFVKQVDAIDRGIVEGSLELHMPSGAVRMLGGRGEGPAAVVDMSSWRALLRLALSGSGGWYEAWVAGEWASPDPVQVFAIFSRNRASLAGPARARGPSRLLRRLRHWLHRNDLRGSRRNIHFHYDLGNDFYRLWLDSGMTYSSALLAGHETLEAGQAAKLQAMLDRTATTPGDTILEIGCGWGSFAELAVKSSRRVHGVTLSTEQKAWAEQRIAGSEGASFALTDYRDITGTYDAVVSIEMAEAVGREYWPAYIAAIGRALKPGGRAALQVITFDDAMFDGYAENVDFIQTYVFPGGMLIRESEFAALAAQNDMTWQDVTPFGQDYAETLRLWRERFDAAVAADLLPKQFDRKFIDLWRYYLMYCEGGFRGGGLDVLQATLVKSA